MAGDFDALEGETNRKPVSNPAVLEHDEKHLSGLAVTPTEKIRVLGSNSLDSGAMLVGPAVFRNMIRRSGVLRKPPVKKETQRQPYSSYTAQPFVILRFRLKEKFDDALPKPQMSTTSPAAVPLASTWGSTPAPAPLVTSPQSPLFSNDEEDGSGSASHQIPDTSISTCENDSRFYPSTHLRSIWSKSNVSTKLTSMPSTHTSGKDIGKVLTGLVPNAEDQTTDDIESLISLDGDIASTIDFSPTLASQRQAATAYLVESLVQDEDILPLYKLAFHKLDQKKFVRNHRRLLYSFFLDLRAKDTSLSPSQELAIDFLRGRHTRTNISSAILSKISPDSDTDINKMKQLVSQKEDSNFSLNRFLAECDSGGQLNQSEFHDKHEAESDNNSDRSSSFDEQDTETVHRTAYAVLEQTRDFLCTGQPFQMYKRNLHRLIQPLEDKSTAPPIPQAESPEQIKGTQHIAEINFRDLPAWTWLHGTTGLLEFGIKGYTQMKSATLQNYEPTTPSKTQQHIEIPLYVSGDDKWVPLAPGKLQISPRWVKWLTFVFYLERTRHDASDPRVQLGVKRPPQDLHRIVSASGAKRITTTKIDIPAPGELGFFLKCLGWLTLIFYIRVTVESKEESGHLTLTNMANLHPPFKSESLSKFSLDFSNKTIGLGYHVSFYRPFIDSVKDACKLWVERTAGCQLSWWPFLQPERPLRQGFTRIYSNPGGRSSRFYDDLETSVAEKLFSGLLVRHFSTPSRLEKWAGLSHESVRLVNSTLSQRLAVQSTPSSTLNTIQEETEPAPKDDTDITDAGGAAQQVVALGQADQQHPPKNTGILFLTGQVDRRITAALSVQLGEDDKTTMQNLRAASRGLSQWRWKVATGVQFYRFKSFHMLDAPRRRIVNLHSDKQRYPEKAHEEFPHYTYSPSPWEEGTHCPCSSAELWYFFDKPEFCGSSKRLIESLPVRRGDPDKSDIVAWGVHIEKCYSVFLIILPVLVTFVFTIGATGWFIFPWLKDHPGDLQNATVPMVLALMVVQSMMSTGISVLLFRWIH